ncbi:ABC transporter substrate-binding protein [Jeotgalibacillus malaysiensis]|uniref:ABC transporter substrate-binding protein n=1 Tax=Jeotgalibacillus malaysiensis TaxID=1508404 RepID=A0A0B5AMM9_9BACL|nr:iron-hydroxamate ABC transporter substrate-binding protein [Jeotgalibacillus malaysiensis]AJD89912.1 ABC transporter substrate-binding protein [Jeotgalibacillus malaysiensis]
MKNLKKTLLPFTIAALALAACGSDEESTSENTEPAEGSSSEETITYESENGPIEVPADPERIVVLSTYAGNVLHLDEDIVGVDSWSASSPNYDFGDAEEVSAENIEKIIELEPDLIIGLASEPNLDQISEIAPTVTFTYGANSYLDQHIEIGKVLNKEEEATEWVEDFKQRAAETGEEIKAEIGEDATVTVIENFDKQLYVFGDNWARGTEILYQEMGLNMPEKVKEEALEPGYYTLSSEVLPEFVGDYLIVSRVADADNSFMETETYKNIPAVQNGNAFVADAEKFYFNDPITLEYQLEFFEENFLGNE